MQTSRKSVKTYSIAQSIKKEIDDTLFQVQLEKRKFLTLERQETYLRDNLDKRQKQLNQLKAKQPQTRNYSSKTYQTHNEITTIDRNHLLIHDNIAQVRNTITTHRKQISKYKEMTQTLQADINNLIKVNEQANSQNIQLETQNEQLTSQIITFRQNNIKNAVEFYQSHANLNKSKHQDENNRKKFSMQQKSFLGSQLRNSKVFPLDGMSQQLKQSGIIFSEHVKDIMADSIPVAKERIKVQIFKNKEKLKITQHYRKFGENLQQMFRVMKQYKGRDDLDFIAQQFVTKERQLQKIQQYIAQLQSRILNGQLLLQARRREDQDLQAEVNTKVQKDDNRYAILQANIQKDINILKRQEHEFYQWFTKVSSILIPLTEQALTRSNASNLIGDIEQYLNVKKQEIDKKNISKTTGIPVFQMSDSKQSYNELLSYQKMRDLATEYVRSKKTY